MPAWRALMDLPRDARLAAMRDPAWRQRLQADLEAFGPTGTRGPARRWVQVYLKQAPSDSLAPWIGQDIVTLAQTQGKTPAEILLDLSLATALRARFAYRTVAPDEEAIVGAILRDPHTIAGSSDAGAHLLTHCNAGYVTVVLQKWVREKGTLSLEEGIHHLTGRPAAILGLRDRGLLKPGYYADLVLFDPAQVGPTAREWLADLPGGGRRPIQRAVGIHAVFVNGQPILEEGVFTGIRPGQIIRGTAPA
jgi:N-acyl-D-aspartate/D-glutamate deacylase